MAGRCGYFAHGIEFSCSHGPDTAKLKIGGRFDVDNIRGFGHLLQRGFGLDVHETNDAITIASRLPTDRLV
jgi:hypothetical protein